MIIERLPRPIVATTNGGYSTRIDIRSTPELQIIGQILENNQPPAEVVIRSAGGTCETVYRLKMERRQPRRTVTEITE